MENSNSYSVGHYVSSGRHCGTIHKKIYQFNAVVYLGLLVPQLFKWFDWNHDPFLVSMKT